MSWYLVASSGPKAGAAFQLERRSITIGRSADNDVVVDDHQVSRSHARLDIQADTYILTDLGSANGTWVNEQRIDAPVILRAGDTVRFGTKPAFVFSTQPSLSGDEALPPQAEVTSKPYPERIPAWVYIVGGLAVLCVLAGLIGAGALYFSSRATVARQERETATAQAQETNAAQTEQAAAAQTEQAAAAQAEQTAAAQAQETAVAQARETAIVQTQRTAAVQAQETATAQAQQTATAQAQEAATAQAQETAIAQETATAQEQQATSLVEKAKSAPPVFGPDSGSLSHKEDGLVEQRVAEDLDMRDFVAEAVFYNPYPTAKGDWDIGFLFRDAGAADELRLTIDSNGGWDLRDQRGDDSNLVEKGQLSNLDTRDRGSNWLVLAADGDRGFFFVNGTFIAELDLSSRTNSGKVSAATGIEEGKAIEGEATAYDGFTVWSLAPQAKQMTIVADTPVAPTPPLPSPAPVPTRKPAGVGLIAFALARGGGKEDLYLMNPDGSNQRQLAVTPGEEWHPDWSPDGSKIVFQCMNTRVDAPGTFDVCVVNADGSGYARLTNWLQKDGMAQRPVWSPDGKKIVFTRELAGGQSLLVMNADGSDLKEIVKLGRDPHWSPDGSKIAFVRWEGGGLQIWTVSPDGSDEKVLTQGDHDHMYPTWSPDGSQIAFEYDHNHVAIMNAGGGPPQVIAERGSNNLDWSPDGSKLVISPPGEGIWLVNADGSGLTQIAQEGKQPSWQAVP